MEDENLLKSLRMKEGRCNWCGGVLMVKNGSLGHFKACINYPRCEYSRDLTLEEKNSLATD